MQFLCDVCGCTEVSADKLDRHKKMFHVPPDSVYGGFVAEKSARDTDDDVTALLRLMAEARKAGYRIGPEVTIGSVSVKIRDEKLSASLGLRGPDPEMSILSEHGFPMEDDE